MNIGLIGCGSVGKETALYLMQNQHILTSRTSCDIRLTAVYTRTPQKALDAGIAQSLIKNDWREITRDTSIDCVVELAGGVDAPPEMIQDALNHKKHVVTANKALLAHHGARLWKTAEENGVHIAFEASCGGGIPIVRAITDGLIANKITAVYGVINGTCNFILSQMAAKKISFDTALRQAQEMGLAEADPTLDVGGFDSGHKIAVLSTLSFNSGVSMDKIPITGISNVSNTDIFFGTTLKYTMQLIAAAILSDNHERNKKQTISIWVHPAFLPNNHPMASLEGARNAIAVVGSETGDTLYCGPGAGGRATNSAIISDIIALANNSAQCVYNSVRMRADKNTGTLQTGMDQLNTGAYIRLTVDDKPGVLAHVAHILQEHDISIRRVLQEDLPHTPESFRAGTGVALIIITHRSKWHTIQNACSQLGTASGVHSPPIVYPIIDF